MVQLQGCRFDSSLLMSPVDYLFISTCDLIRLHHVKVDEYFSHVIWDVLVSSAGRQHCMCYVILPNACVV